LAAVTSARASDNTISRKEPRMVCILLLPWAGHRPRLGAALVPAGGGVAVMLAAGPAQAHLRGCRGIARRRADDRLAVQAVLHVPGQ
jgi:hypothetical protein